jgi:hypothetical protein
MWETHLDKDLGYRQRRGSLGPRISLGTILKIELTITQTADPRMNTLSVVSPYL